jgi:hypothetical protein
MARSSAAERRPNTPQMTIRFTVTPALLIAGQRAGSTFVHSMWRIGSVLVALFALLAVAAGLIVGRSIGDILQRSWSIVIAFPLLWLVAFPLISRWQLYRVWNTSPVYQGDHIYTFASNGIELVTPVGRSEISWDGIVKVDETDDMVLLYFGKSFPHVIPKAAYPTGGLAEFRATVTGAIGTRARWRD